MTILPGERCTEVQCGKDDQVARPLFENLVEVPDLEMTAHADQQRALADAASRPHPRRDVDTPLPVHVGRRNETQPSSQQHVARLALPAVEHDALGFVAVNGDAVASADDHAGMIGMKTDEQFVADSSRLYRDTEMVWQGEFALGVDRRNRTANEKIGHGTHTAKSGFTSPAHELCSVNHHSYLT
ncbi:hypothetical protein U1707_04490 [Sphingomonas sp. PB2P12]|uniref:hypothetical protein n=1 Tax=Sphingomonas sandaracina TaxID=3096157 RepID=UPI002FC8A03A